MMHHPGHHPTHHEARELALTKTADNLRYNVTFEKRLLAGRLTWVVAIRRRPGNKMLWSMPQLTAEARGVKGGAQGAARLANALCDRIIAAGGADACSAHTLVEELLTRK